MWWWRGCCCCCCNAVCLSVCVAPNTPALRPPRLPLIGRAAGVGLYYKYLKSVPLHSLLLYGNLLGAALQCSNILLASHFNRTLGLDDHLFVLGGSVVTGVITNVL